MVYASRWELDSPPRLNWDRMRTNKNKELERLSQLYMKQIETAGIHYVEGRGKLLDAHTVEVNGQKFTVRSLPCLVHGRKFPKLQPSSCQFSFTIWQCDAISDGSQLIQIQSWPSLAPISACLHSPPWQALY